MNVCRLFVLSLDPIRNRTVVTTWLYDAKYTLGGWVGHVHGKRFKSTFVCLFVCLFICFLFCYCVCVCVRVCVWFSLSVSLFVFRFCSNLLRIHLTLLHQN